MMTVHKAKGLEFPVVILAGPHLRGVPGHSKPHVDMDPRVMARAALRVCALRASGGRRGVAETRSAEAVRVLCWRPPEPGTLLSYRSAEMRRWKAGSTSSILPSTHPREDANAVRTTHSGVRRLETIVSSPENRGCPSRR